MNYTTYLFDFDYTLADSSRGIVMCFRTVLERHQYTNVTDESIKRTIGKTLEESFTILTGVTDPEQLTALRKEYSIETDTYMNVNTFLFPETISTLTELKKQGARIGIISTKHRYRILGFLKDYLPEDFFDIIIGGEDVKQAKPSPEGLLLAIERLGVLPEQTLYIGDSTVDAETAQAAAVDFVGVTNGMTTKEELQAYPNLKIINSLDGLLTSANKKSKFTWLRAKACIRLVHIKQIQGRRIRETTIGNCICKNCNHAFAGSYCPNCGQHKDTPRFVLRSAIQNILGGITNIDHGFGYTLIELLVRPGYMIHDFIAGKRVRYFRPFQTLFVLAAIYILLVQLIDPGALRKKKEETPLTPKQELLGAHKSIMEELTALETNDSIARKLLRQSAEKIEKKIAKLNAIEQQATIDNGNSQKLEAEQEKHISLENRLKQIPFFASVFDLIDNWSHGNKAATVLCLVPILALGTKWAFRRRTFNREYNYIELMFAQTYMACQILLISILYFPLNRKADLDSMYDIPWWLVFLLSVWIYKQLFRGSWMKTAQRTALMYLYSLLIIILLAIVVLGLYVLVAICYEWLYYGG